MKGIADAELRIPDLGLCGAYCVLGNGLTRDQVKRYERIAANRKVRMKQLIKLKVNDQLHEVWTAVHKTLLEVLREDLNLTGTKHGCELGECGTCTVLVDGQPQLSCLLLPVELAGREITTVEGLAHMGQAHPLQTAFAELGAAQCGYCTPGVLVTAKALLDENPLPTRNDVREALAGNLCRCTGYLKILEAVELAAERMNEDKAPATELQEVLST